MIPILNQQILTIASAETIRRIVRQTRALSNVHFRIRSMNKRDLTKVNQLLDEEKWIMEKAYLDCAFKTNPRDFVVAETVDREIIGCYSSLSFTDNLYVSGLWIVHKDYRSSSVGYKLAKTINRFPDRNYAGFIWPHMQEKVNMITKSNTTQAYTTWYNSGRIEQHVDLNPRHKHEEQVLIHPLKHSTLSAVIQYDTQIHKIPRKAYIINWISNPQLKTYVAVKDGKLCGYAVLRFQDTCLQIAPLYADNEYVANEVFLKIASEVPKGCVVGFTSPLENNAATKLAARYGMMGQGMPLLMVFRHDPIHLDINKIYALSSTSFGLC
ncbi:holothin acyltransferase-like [Ylistrum balloti]|uniref:holothin acyltransferase-like n=1 Tax=Ylistrum balloti TaxID=509963 RepID=UPI0029058279|nr:holothin acyltransferase-like [Ylistrum balloti]